MRKRTGKTAEVPSKLFTSIHSDEGLESLPAARMERTKALCGLSRIKNAHEPLERDIQASCLRYLKTQLPLAWRNAEDPRSRTRTGTPDIIAILPDGRFLGVEVKRNAKAKLRDSQIKFMTDIGKTHAFYVVTYAVDHLAKCVSAILRGDYDHNRSD